MAYDQAKLVEKLRAINATQQSIETVSMYCQVLKRHAANVVADWFAEYNKQAPPRKLALLFLANDVLQNSRKKGAEYIAQFHRVLPRALRTAVSSGDPKLAKGAKRLVEIWEERHVLGSQSLEAVKDAVGLSRASSKDAPPKDNNSLSSVLQQAQRAHDARVAASAACRTLPDPDAAQLDQQALVRSVGLLTTASASADAEQLARQRAVQVLTLAIQQQQAALAELATLTAGWQAQITRLEAVQGALLILLLVYLHQRVMRLPHSSCCCSARHAT